MDTSEISEGAAGTAASAQAQLGLLLIVIAALFFAIVGLSFLLAPAGILRDNNFSEFGILPETAALFNVGLVGIGLLDFFAAWLWRRRHSGRLTPWVFIVAGGGAIASGVINVNIENQVHAVASAAGFLGHVAMPFVLGAGSASLAVRLLSYFAGLTSIGFLGTWVVGVVGYPNVFGTFGQGGTQALTFLPVVVWTLGFGGYLMALQKSAAAKGRGAVMPGG